MASDDTDRFEDDGFEHDASVSLTRDKWIQAQRDLVTTTLDYNLQAVARLVSDGAIDLSPAFQRRDRWDVQRQSQLIESFLMNVPLPPIFLNEDDFGSYSIIDGKQRLTAVSDYMLDKFPLQGLDVFSEAEGLRFSELDRGLRMVLETRASLRAIIILRMSDPEIKYQVFQRLNTGGVRLNAQELRNVAFAGTFNDAIVEWAGSDVFAGLLGIQSDLDRERSALWKQMRDVELVLRFFTLRENWSVFSGSLVRDMNNFAGTHRQDNKKSLAALKKEFDASVAKVEVVFADTAFRRYNSDQGRHGNQVLASVYDAQMLALSAFELNDLKDNAQQIRDGMKALFADAEFLAVVGAATNTPRSLRERVERTAAMVQAAIGD